MLLDDHFTTKLNLSWDAVWIFMKLSLNTVFEDLCLCVRVSDGAFVSSSS